MGENYEVLPAVTPVVNIDGIEYQPQFQAFSQAGALVAGTVVVTLRPPDTKHSRLWTYVGLGRTNSAIGDLCRLERVIGFSGNSITIAWDDTNRVAANYPANVPLQLIGGLLLTNDAGGGLKQLEGMRPQLSTNDYPIQLSIVSAAAIGNYSVVGIFIDVPASAPLNNLFLP